MKAIFENENLLVIEKQAGIVVYSEGPSQENDGETLIDQITKEFPKIKNVGEPPRYGMIHRLDKETSGIILIAKNNQALEYFQKEFKEKRVQKKYILLVNGTIEENNGVIEGLMARAPKDKRKQKIYLPYEPFGNKNLRDSKTEYRVLERFKNFTLVEASPKTGRKHQLRVHFTHLGHPIAGDKLYSFKDQTIIPGLQRQFLHCSQLKINLFNGKTKEFHSELPKDIKELLEKLQ
ncbi:MAG: RluA family pseudouridine synthase [Patescibacteria group bacterium]